MELLTPEEGERALSYARQVITECIVGQKHSSQEFSGIFQEKRGVFVTLTKHSNLRGCIGFPYPVMPLQAAIRDAAIAAATEDPRFPPVRAAELSDITVEITVLTEPVEVSISPDMRPAAIQVGTHGLIIKGYGRSGLLLPQVAVEWNWDGREFLNHTCEKAGLPRECWREASVQLFTFEGQIFTEKIQR